jgi:hypothetical protein
MQKWLCWIVLLLCFSASFKLEAASIKYISSDKAISFNSSELSKKKAEIPDSLKPRKHKLIAILCALPPFGFIAMHRMYLGTANAVPMFYIATLGGGIYTLPFIDLVLIILTKDVNTYAHDRRLFMWTHKKVKHKKT